MVIIHVPSDAADRFVRNKRHIVTIQQVIIDADIDSTAVPASRIPLHGAAGNREMRVPGILLFRIDENGSTVTSGLIRIETGTRDVYLCVAAHENGSASARFILCEGTPTYLMLSTIRNLLEYYGTAIIWGRILCKLTIVYDRMAQITKKNRAATHPR